LFLKKNSACLIQKNIFGVGPETMRHDKKENKIWFFKSRLERKENSLG
jgi:hypothetical protein